MAQVYLAFGANLGNREQNIKDAIAQLQSDGISIIKISSLIETEAVGGPLQGKYLNAVALVATNYSPPELLKVTQKIEKKLGRQRDGIQNSPRTIDIDILLYDNVHMKSDDLIIPHPRMRQRDFVMKPLLEIAPRIVEKLQQ